MQTDNVFQILQLCDQRSLHELKRCCVAFLITNLDQPALRAAFTSFISWADTGKLAFSCRHVLQLENGRPGDGRGRHTAQ